MWQLKKFEVKHEHKVQVRDPADECRAADTVHFTDEPAEYDHSAVSAKGTAKMGRVFFPRHAIDF